MKLLLALVVIGIAVYFVTQRAPAPVERSTNDSEAVDATAATPAPQRKSPRFDERDFELTADNIRDELSRTAEVVREKARVAGERIDDARIVAVIKGKLALDADLSALDVKVSAEDGRVVLDGAVAAPDLIARAVDLALHTDGVHHVQSRLQVSAGGTRE